MTIQSEIKWHLEAFRIGIPVIATIVSITFAFAALDKGMSINQQRLDVIEGNHLTHIQSAVEILAENQITIREDIAEIKTLIKANNQ